jgi:hypothetical protein
LLHRNGFDWVVFTGIPPVIKGLEKLGFGLEPLGAADPGCLSATELAHWGSYYDKQPQVVAGNIPAAINTLATHKLYSGVLSLLEPQIDRLAASFRDSDLSFGTHAFSA